MNSSVTIENEFIQLCMSSCGSEVMYAKEMMYISNFDYAYSGKNNVRDM